MAVQFNDIADYFKSGLSFQDLYKLSNFGNTLLPQNTTHRAQALTVHRRETRGDALLKRRKISMSKMSPYTTPGKQRCEKPVNDPALEKAVEERRAKLERYQQMKRAKQQAEKEKRRPPFKVGVASAAGVVANGLSRLESSRLVNFTRIGTVEPVNKCNIRETRTVRLRNAKKEEAVAKEIKSNGVAPRGNKRIGTIISTSSESSLASEKSQAHTYRTRSRTNATKEVKPASSSISRKPPQEKKNTGQRAQNSTKPPSLSKQHLDVVPETAANTNQRRMKKATKPLSLAEEGQEAVVPEIPVKKNNNKAKVLTKPSSSVEKMEIIVTKTPKKSKNIKPPSIEHDQGVVVVEIPVKKINKAKTLITLSSSEDKLEVIVAKTPKKHRNKEKTRIDPPSIEDDQGVDLLEIPVKKNRIAKTPTKPSSNEEKLEVVVTKTPVEKNNKQKTPIKPTSSIEDKLEVVTKTPVKKNNKEKTPIKLISSIEENLGVVISKTPAKKNTKKAKPAPVNEENLKTAPVQDERPVLSDITPDKNIPAVYISPFVTVSRGKNSARKEFQKRRSLNDLQDIQLDKNIEVYTSPTAGAAFFRNILEENISRLQSMCKEWETYKEKESPPEEACDMINVAIGQSQLLINKKFQQFRGLIDSCFAKNPEAPVTCEDLHGFWDLIHMQVVNLDKRFDNLRKLRENSWVEIIPEKKDVVKKIQPVKKKAVKSSSNLKDIIKAARQLKKDQENNKFEGGFFSVSSPAKNTERIAKNTPRSSVRSRRSSVSVNSPGLKVMRASANIKQVAEGKTPTRSILKSGSCFTAERKTVLFQDHDDESDVENGKVLELAKTPRRSQRQSRCASKLF